MKIMAFGFPSLSDPLIPPPKWHEAGTSASVLDGCVECMYICKQILPGSKPWVTVSASLMPSSPTSADRERKREGEENLTNEKTFIVKGRGMEGVAHPNSTDFTVPSS